MVNEKIQYVSNFIYNMSLNEKLAEVENIGDSDLLHLIMYNYNWDDGFEIPIIVIENQNCEMSTALMIFYSAGGEEVLANKQSISTNKNGRLKFLSELYNSIIANKFTRGDIYFEPPLTKVELYKLKKLLSDSERVFIESIGSRRIEINV